MPTYRFPKFAWFLFVLALLTSFPAFAQDATHTPALEATAEVTAEATVEVAQPACWDVEDILIHSYMFGKQYHNSGDTYDGEVVPRMEMWLSNPYEPLQVFVFNLQLDCWTPADEVEHFATWMAPSTDCELTHRDIYWAAIAAIEEAAGAPVDAKLGIYVQWGTRSDWSDWYQVRVPDYVPDWKVIRYEVDERGCLTATDEIV